MDIFFKLTLLDLGHISIFEGFPTPRVLGKNRAHFLAQKLKSWIFQASLAGSKW